MHATIKHYVLIEPIIALTQTGQGGIPDALTITVINFQSKFMANS